MGRRDKMAFNRLGKLWLPVNTFLGWESIDLGSASTTSLQKSLSQGNTLLKKSGEVAAEIVSAQMAEADEIHTVLPIPWDLNRNKKVLGRVFFVHEAAAADTGLIWKIGTLFFAKQVVVPEMQANVDKLVTCTAHTCGVTADSLEVTDWNDLYWDRYLTPTDILAGLTLEFDTNGAAADDECNLLGLELAYEIEAFADGPLPTIDNELLNNLVY